MDWSEVKIRVATEHGDLAADIAQMTVPYGIYIEDYSDIETEAPRIAHIDLIDEELLARDRTVTTIHIYIKPSENPMEAVSFIKNRLDDLDVKFESEVNNVKEEDWATAWKEYYHPIRVGEHVIVCPTWESCEKGEKDIVISLDPGMAFGTGTHATTRLCMELLEQNVYENAAVLDIGTGSGILSITAKLLGAERVVGVDIDDVAIRVANENAHENGLSEKIEFYCGDLADKVSGKFNIITANIVADIILRLAPDVNGLLEKDGVFIASGIIDTRKDDVIDGLIEYNLEVVGIKESEGWVAIACKNRG